MARITYGKVDLEQYVTESLKAIGTKLGITIPVRTEGWFALRQTLENASSQIAIAIGAPVSIDVSNPTAMAASVAAVVPGILGGTPTPTPSPTVAISSAVSQNEGNSGSTSFDYTLTLTRNGSTASYPFTWSVAGDGTGNSAVANDFGGSFPSGSGAFAPGETTKTISVLVSGDTTFEPNEGFVLSISVPTVGSVSANGTIINDDAGAYSFSNTEAQALYNRDNTIAPNDTRKQAIDTLVGALKTAGVWAKLDVLQVFAAASKSSALLNWLGTSFTASEGGGAPVFVIDRGYFTNGLTDYIDLGFAPSAGTNFAQNSASYGAWMRTPAGVARANSILGTLTTSNCTLNPRTTTNLIGTRINGTTADTSVASTDFYGLTSANRPSSSQVQSGRNGVRGSLVASTSASRSAINFGFGKANSTFAEGQISAFYAGAALADADELALYNALSTYMGAVGVAALNPTTRTLASSGNTKLPDGSAAPTATKGMPATGLVKRSDGKWYVGNGLASGFPALCFTRLSSSFALEQEFTVTSLGLGTPPGNGSVQGMCIDAGSPNLMWVVLKVANSSTTTYLFSFDMTTEAVVQAPIALPTLSCNGVADDGVSGTLLISQDVTTSIGGLIRINKTTGANTGAFALTMPGDTDQMFAVTATSGNFLAGDILLTAGANGANGTVSVLRKDDYGGYCARRIDTLTDSTAIEGIVLAGGVYYVCNDGATHPDAIGTNRVATYAA